MKIRLIFIYRPASSRAICSRLETVSKSALWKTTVSETIDSLVNSTFIKQTNEREGKNSTFA